MELFVLYIGAKKVEILWKYDAREHCQFCHLFCRNEKKEEIVDGLLLWDKIGAQWTIKNKFDLFPHCGCCKNWCLTLLCPRRPKPTMNLSCLIISWIMFTHCAPKACCKPHIWWSWSPAWHCTYNNTIGANKLKWNGNIMLPNIVISTQLKCVSSAIYCVGMRRNMWPDWWAMNQQIQTLSFPLILNAKCPTNTLIIVFLTAGVAKTVLRPVHRNPQWILLVCGSPWS